MEISLSRLSISERALSRVGTVVQKYRIERLIGVGGMAAVYAATHRNGHRVAMKFLLDRFWDDPEIGRLFGREAYVANQVGHPGAVPVLDDDIDEEGCPFLVMPLLEGETLRTRWERAKRRLALAEVVVVMTDVLEVLESAHACGVVHRDIKPDNLFVTTKGEVRVLDFGIARRSDSDGTTTLGGRLVGTPAFMPPEQALGDRNAMGPHSDGWAVGATMFALLSGEFVHKAENSGAQLVAAATQVARSLTEVLPDVPSAIGGVVDKALAFDAAGRWHSAREMREALLAALAEALGESADAVATRVRGELMTELTTRNAGLQAIVTRPANRAHPGDTLGEHAVHTSSLDDERHAHEEPRVELRAAKGDASPTVMAAGVVKKPARGRRWIWRAVAAGVVSIVLGGILIAKRNHATVERAVLPTVPTVPGTAVVALPISPKCTKEAATHYREGLAALQKVTWEAAYAAFEKGVAADPACPELLVQLAATGYFLSHPLTLERELTRSALSLRDRLSERDRAFLDAFSPLVISDPADRLESARRFHALEVKYPLDAQILNYAGSGHMMADPDKATVEHVLDIGRRLVAVDPNDATGWETQGQAYRLLGGQDDEELRAVDRCLQVSPGASDCLEDRVHNLRRRGDCEAAVVDARHRLANAPGSYRGYLLLGQTLASNGSSLDAVEAVLERLRDTGPEEGRDVRYLYYMTLLAALGGDFEKGERLARQLSSQARDSSALFHNARATAILSDLLIETGRDAHAFAIADRFWGQRDAWTEGSWRTTAYDPILLGAIFTSKRDGRQRWSVLSESWEAHSGTALGKRRAWALRWGPIAHTREVALEAVRHRPGEGFVPGAGYDLQQFIPMMAESFEGYIYLGSGDYTRAVQQLELSTKSCYSLELPFISTRSYFWLGQAKEGGGDVAGACNDYAVVLKRWENAKPRSVTAEAAKKRMGALGCAARR